MKHQVNPEELLQIVTLYHHILLPQLYAFFPDYEKEKINAAVRYLCKKERIICEENMISCYFSQTPIDINLLNALWILAALSQKCKIEEHWVSSYPGLIYFYMQGEFYEIIHAKSGFEKMLQYRLDEEEAKKIILIDSYEQMNQLLIPNVQGYCTVEASTVQFYKIKKEKKNEEVDVPNGEFIKGQ